MRQLKITKSITNRDGTTLDRYMQEINKYELISPEKEVELAQRIKGGDKEALKELTLANLRFVISVAKQYQNQGLSLQDLIAEGNIGLITAAERFDETRGFKFISYAVWWIRQSIMAAIHQKAKPIRIPLNKVTMISKITKLNHEFIIEYDRLPNDEELKQILGLTDKQLKEIHKPVYKSIDAPINDDNDTYGDKLADMNTAQPDQTMTHSESLRIDLERAMSNLSKREKDILTRSEGFYGETLTLEELAEKWQITRERARQIKAMAKRKVFKQKEQLKTYL